MRRIMVLLVLSGAGITLGCGGMGGSETDGDFYTTQKIEQVSSQESDGWQLEYYRNRAYTCGVSGYQTFVLAYRKKDSLSDPKPLWVRLHGGGGGNWLSDGSYTPEGHDPRSLDEETAQQLAGSLREKGLIANVTDHAAGFRFLLPSLCDHDFYSGTGEVDLHNPNTPDENGDQRRVDGALATLSALAFARARLNATHVFLHGTSAGSMGAMTLAAELGRQEQRLSGAVLDSWVLNPYLLDLMKTGCRSERPNNPRLTGVLTPLEPELFLERLGYYGKPEHMPEESVAKGIVQTPLFLTWSRDDAGMCGQKILTLEDSHGATAKGEASWLMNMPLSEAIDQYNPGGASRWRRLCVDNPELDDSDCDRHSPTRFSAAEFGGDRSRQGEDYNQVIMAWVGERLGEAVP